MDWEKAKKIIIIFLVALNSLLLALNINQNREYELSSAREKAVYEMLSNNGIGIYTEIVQKFKPMYELIINVPTPDIDALRSEYMGNEESSISTLSNTTVIESDTKKLEINNNTIIFTDYSPDEPVSDFSLEGAQKIASRFLKEHVNSSNNYSLDGITRGENSFTFRYYRKYKGFNIFFGETTVTVTPEGVTNFSTVEFNTTSFGDVSMDICASDEALLTFMRQAKSDYKDGGIFIDRMEIGYNLQENTDINEGNQLRLIPCYQIYLVGIDEPYVINAYTNTIISQ